MAGNLKDWADYDNFKPYLDSMYQRVIREFADELLVINVGGYIGSSTAKEIECALKKGIPIKYWEDKKGGHHGRERDFQEADTAHQADQ